MNIVELEAELIKREHLREEAEKDAALRFGVLLADDEPDSRFLTCRGLERSPCLRPVAEVQDGREVIDYLSGNGKYADRATYPFPSLLLLDIEMPCMTGFEVLQWIQEHPLRGLRVVMLSASLDPENIKKALDLGADYYQAKPFDIKKMDALIRRLEVLMVLMHHREPDALMEQSSQPAEEMQPYTTLQLVDARGGNWRESITVSADTQRNFILILKDENDLERLWAALGTTNIVPERMLRWGILAIAEALRSEDYTLLLEIYRDSPVYLIEQLTLDRNVPPRTQRYMLYCELRGIISHHPTIEDAGISLLSYLNFFKRARLLPLAGIYEYARGKWARVKKLTSDGAPDR